ncbi:MAG: nascent polypeptide-associated complex protein [Thermoplasmata archaeon]
MKISDRQLQRMMKQMGVKMEEIDALEVKIIGKEFDYVIKNPKITKVVAQGEEVLQVQGQIEKIEKEKLPFSEDDIKIVIDQTGCSRDDAIQALKNANGEPAEAIIEIMKTHGKSVK